MHMRLNKGDIVWIDNAPLIASPEPTGRITRCEVLLPSPESEARVYVAPEGGSALYVAKHWITNRTAAAS